MSDLNIAALKRKAGCSEGCVLRVDEHVDKVTHYAPGEVVGLWHPFDTSEPEWVNGVIEWLRGLKHE